MGLAPAEAATASDALRGSAFVNTVIFISISILLSLIVNPLAAYALSRFRLRWTEQILLFLLATIVSAFMAANTITNNC